MLNDLTRIPNFFIVGAPRCGTGSMWTYLRSHPDVFMPVEKEFYFFDSDLWAKDKRGLTLAEYLGYFSGADGKKRIGEATPSYLRSRRAAQAIKALSPEAKIIIMLRNPVDVMHSLHSCALDGLEPIRIFNRSAGTGRQASGREQIGYREFADFPDQLQRYFDSFGLENVHTIIFDDLKRDSAAVCRGVLCFLGVRHDFAAEFPWIHGNTEIRNLRLQTTVVQPPRSLRSLARALVPQQLPISNSTRSAEIQPCGSAAGAHGSRLETATAERA